MFWWLKRYLKVLRHKIPQILTDLLPKTGKLCSGSSTLCDRTDRAQFPYFEGQIRTPVFACKIRTKYGSSVLVGSPEPVVAPRGRPPGASLNVIGLPYGKSKWKKKQESKPDAKRSKGLSRSVFHRNQQREIYQHQTSKKRKWRCDELALHIRDISGEDLQHFTIKPRDYTLPTCFTAGQQTGGGIFWSPSAAHAPAKRSPHGQSQRVKPFPAG